MTMPLGEALTQWERTNAMPEFHELFASRVSRRRDGKYQLVHNGQTFTSRRRRSLRRTFARLLAREAVDAA